MLNLLCSNSSTFTQTLPYTWECSLIRMTCGARFREEPALAGTDNEAGTIYCIHSCTSFCFLSSLFNSIPVNVGGAVFEICINHPDGACYFIATGSERTWSRKIFFSDNFKTKFDRVLLKSSDFCNKF